MIRDLQGGQTLTSRHHKPHTLNRASSGAFSAWRSLLVALSAVVLSCLGLVTGPSESASAGSSPALLAFDDGTSGVYETNFAPGSPERLVAPAGLYPAFSPSGTELAYNLERGDGSTLTNSIVIASRTGSDPRDLVTGSTLLDGNPNSVLYPMAWSPNGEEIAYGCDGNEYLDPSDTSIVVAEWEQLCVVNVATGKHEMITDPSSDQYPIVPGGLDQRMSWTLNGKDVIATVVAPGPCQTGSTPIGCGSATIGAIDVATGSTTLLDQGSTTYYDYAPDVSPNGEQIIFDRITSLSGIPFGLELMGIGGGATTLVINHATTSLAAGSIFTPNGKEILYTGYSASDEYNVQAYEVPISGEGEPVQITTGNVSVYDMSVSAAPTTCTVPDLTGKTVAESKTLLTQAACSLGKVTGSTSRRVVSQSPKPKLDEPAGTKVNIRTG
jgi:Tol biopolymer transport system component